MTMGLPAWSSSLLTSCPWWQRIALSSLVTTSRGCFCWTTALWKTTHRFQSSALLPAPSIVTSIHRKSPWRCLSSSSFSSSSMMSSLSQSEKNAPLQQWIAALSQISAQDLKIDPDVVGDNKKETYVQALLGDKILGSAAATTLVTNAINETQQESETDPQARFDTGSLTKRISFAVSNSFLAEHVDQILPGYHIDRSSEWEIGTAVEAAVYAVHQIQPAAVMELAQFLVHHAAMAPPLSMNAKGEFLERGGQFRHSRRVGGTDHDPIFEAMAVCQNHTATARASNKKRAEMEAAQRVLELLNPQQVVPDAEEEGEPNATISETPTTTSLGVELSNVTVIPPPPRPTNTTNDNDTATNFTYGQWEPFEVVKGIELENGETARDWWLRGASIPLKAFQRAMHAAQIFPDHIAAVDSWIRRVPADERTATASVFVLVVDTQQQCHYVPVVTAASGTQARRIVGVQANQIIAKLVGIQLPSSNGNDKAEKRSDMLHCEVNGTSTMAAKNRTALEELTVALLREPSRDRGLG